MASKPKKGRTAKPRIGRPPLPDAERRETLVRVLVTESEYEELQRAAAAAGASVSGWLRLLALERARGGGR